MLSVIFEAEKREEEEGEKTENNERLFEKKKSAN